MNNLKIEVSITEGIGAVNVQFAGLSTPSYDFDTTSSKEDTIDADTYIVLIVGYTGGHLNLKIHNPIGTVIYNKTYAGHFHDNTVLKIN
jgi:hypothetical protein